MMAPVAIRVYAHVGFSRAGNDSNRMLRQPPIGRETLTPDKPRSVQETAPAGTALLLVQTDHDEPVHYEITPSGQKARPATIDSPTLTGETLVEFGPGWQIEFLMRP